MRTLTLWEAYVKADANLKTAEQVKWHRAAVRYSRLCRKLEAEITRRLEAETQE